MLARIRSRSRLAVVATALAALVLAACGGQGTPTTPTDPSPTDPSPTDPAPTDPAPTDPIPTDPAGYVTVFFARDGDDRVWIEPEELAAAGADPTALAAAIERLFGGVPDDPELWTAVPEGVEVLSVELDGDVLVVDVSQALADASGSSTQEVAFAEQLAHTAATSEGVVAVRLLVEGEEIDELWGHLDWSEPIEPDPFALSPITIEQPRRGEPQPAGEVVVGGQATVFEATLMLRLLDGSGEVLEETAVTASAGGPERGTWEHAFEIDEPGDYVVEAEEIDASDGEGRPPFLVRRDVEVVAAS